MELQTERLVLRPVTEDDLETMLSIRNAPEVIATTGTAAPLPSERMAGQLQRRAASWRDRGLGSFLILRDGDPVGFVEVAPIGEGSGVDPEEIEVGVVVHPENEKSLRALAKAPGVRKVDEELYELTAAAFLG